MSVSTVLSKVESNLKERLGAGKTAVSGEVTAVKNLATNLIGLKPIVGVVDFGVATATNVGNFVKTQAQIFRRWAQ